MDDLLNTSDVFKALGAVAMMASKQCAIIIYVHYYNKTKTDYVTSLYLKGNYFLSYYKLYNEY